MKLNYIQLPVVNIPTYELKGYHQIVASFFRVRSCSLVLARSLSRCACVCACVYASARACAWVWGCVCVRTCVPDCRYRLLASHGRGRGCCRMTREGLSLLCGQSRSSVWAPVASHQRKGRVCCRMTREALSLLCVSASRRSLRHAAVQYPSHQASGYHSNYTGLVLGSNLCVCVCVCAQWRVK